MTSGDIRIGVLNDNAKGASGVRSQRGLSFWIERQPAVRAVLGGMHLPQARKERVQATTADYLEALDLEPCAPCHCTGRRATAPLGEQLPGAFIEAATGRELKLAFSPHQTRQSLGHARRAASRD